MAPIVGICIFIIVLAIIYGILCFIRRAILWYFQIDRIVELLEQIAKKNI